MPRHRCSRRTEGGTTGAWAPRLKQGYARGQARCGRLQGDACQGGNADLDPIEVARAVVYMTNQSGAKYKEPRRLPLGSHEDSRAHREQIVL